MSVSKGGENGQIWASGRRFGNVVGMSDEKFTMRAAVLWGTIPKEARERILANVFCVKCGGPATMTNFTGEEVKGDLRLKGSCAKCGHEVVRIVETSERDDSGN